MKSRFSFQDNFMLYPQRITCPVMSRPVKSKFEVINSLLSPTIRSLELLPSPSWQNISGIECWWLKLRCGNLIPVSQTEEAKACRLHQ
ncbi:hypothetical protein Mapa_009704 [Marchantia paleacea]|nr:hypothetical protein Mapa_009704 [Marchantia paleacea]